MFFSYAVQAQVHVHVQLVYNVSSVIDSTGRCLLPPSLLGGFYAAGH